MKQHTLFTKPISASLLKSIGVGNRVEDETLRDYQQENKQKIYDAWARCRSVMLQMPTGTGKTKLFVSIIKDIYNYGVDTKIAIKVLILVHRTELIDQIDEELGYRYNLAHGIIQSGEKERKIYPIQLASVQTLSRRVEKWTEKEFDFIIVDEAHHVKAESYQKIIKAFPHAKLLGVTATPVRLNGHGFTDTFDELIVSPSVKHFIDEGYLSQYEYYSVARSSFIQKEIDGIKKFSQGDYAESELERVCDNDRIRAQVVKTYLDFANDKKGIVYTINKEHNKNLCEEFKANGVSAVAIDSDTPKEMREQYIQQFRRGDFKIICNVNLFTEGFDCPDIEFIQLARPTKSLAMYLQQVGRGLRISESKEKTLFLDNVGLYNRFGFPSSRRMWRHHFEGKYDGNKTEEEVEGKKEEATIELTEKRERHQNLEEGHERVHLIQSTEEEEYLDKRTEELKKWLQDVYASSKKAYSNAYNNSYRITHVNGLELSYDSNDFFHFMQLKMNQPTYGLEKILDTQKFTFYEIQDGRIKDETYRLCNDYNELLTKLNEEMYDLKSLYFKEDLKSFLRKYKEYDFTQAELRDIIPSLFEKQCYIYSTSWNLEERIHFSQVITEVFWECIMKGKRSLNIIKDLAKITLQEIIERNNNGKENKIRKRT